MPTSENVIIKKSGEKLYIEMEFDACLNTDTAISTIESITATNCGNASSDLVFTDEVISGQSVLVYVAGGDAGERYNIIITITTDTDEIIIGEGTLVIEG